MLMICYSCPWIIYACTYIVNSSHCFHSIFIPYVYTSSAPDSRVPCPETSSDVFSLYPLHTLKCDTLNKFLCTKLMLYHTSAHDMKLEQVWVVWYPTKVIHRQTTKKSIMNYKVMKSDPLVCLRLSANPCYEMFDLSLLLHTLSISSKCKWK